MNRARVIAWFGMLVWLTGCVERVQVLELADAEAGVEPRDAGLDADAAAGADADARVPEEDAAPATGSARVLAAFEQSCVVNESGLYCWGLNTDGQVGVGSRQPMAVGRPERIETVAEYIQLCTGESHTCGLRRGGALDCWGANADGQLGLGDYETRAAPTLLAEAPRFASVACSGGHITCGLTEEGALYCWGNNSEGALGQGEGAAVGQNSATPLLVPLAQPASQVSVGQGHVCAILESGALYCWGRNGQFQVGVPPPPGTEQVRTPTEVTGGGSYLQVSAGQTYTCAVRMDGRLFCWGRDKDFDGHLGLGMTRFDVREPTQVGDDDDYLEVHATWFHTCALRSQRRLFCWGRNEEGQQGQGDLVARYEPELVESGGQAWQALAVGRFHTCGLRAGAVYCWGKNDNFFLQLGLGDTQRRSVPTWVPIP